VTAIGPGKYMPPGKAPPLEQPCKPRWDIAAPLEILSNPAKEAPGPADVCSGGIWHGTCLGRLPEKTSSRHRSIAHEYQ
jgi:hypothetical protein